MHFHKKVPHFLKLSVGRSDAQRETCETRKISTIDIRPTALLRCCNVTFVEMVRDSGGGRGFDTDHFDTLLLPVVKRRPKAALEKEMEAVVAWCEAYSLVDQYLPRCYLQSNLSRSRPSVLFANKVLRQPFTSWSCHSLHCLKPFASMLPR